MDAHVHDPNTQVINGTYRGNQPVIHHYNPNTNLVVTPKPNGEYWTGWRTGGLQLNSLLRTGNLQ